MFIYSHLIFLQLAIIIITGERFKIMTLLVMKSSLTSFLFLPLLGRNTCIFFSILFSKTLALGPILKWKPKFHSHRNHEEKPQLMKMFLILTISISNRRRKIQSQIVADIVRFKSVVNLLVNLNFACQSRFETHEVYYMIKEPH